MKKSRLIKMTTLLVIFVVSLLLTLNFSLAVCDGNPPPSSGVWWININTNCSNEIIIVNDSIVVNNSANFTITNITLLMNGTTNGDIGINVTNNSTGMYVYNSTIKSNNINNYTWWVNSSFIMDGGSISNCGYNGGISTYGFTLFGENLKINNVIIFNNLVGIHIIGKNNNVTSLNISNISWYGIFIESNNNILNNIQIEKILTYSNIYINKANNTLINNIFINISTNKTGIATANNAKNVTVINSIILNNGTSYSVDATLNSDVYLTNVSVNLSKLRIGATGNITFQHFVMFNVSDNVSYAPISDVNVTLRNNSVFMSYVTNATGLTPWFLVSEGVAKQGFDGVNWNISYNPYNVSFNHSNYTFKSANYSFNHSGVYLANLSLVDGAPPNFIFIYPSDNNISDMSERNFVYNVTDESNITNCSLYVNGVFNQSNASISRTGQNYFRVDFFGNYFSFNWSISCTDEYDNTNATPTRNYTYDAGYVIDCKELNISNTTYRLQTDVTNTGTCFDITANNITLDCQGFNINYSSNGSDSEFGVNIVDIKNVVVKNCHIYEGNLTSTNSYPIRLYNTNNSVIFNNTLSTIGNSSYGIYSFDGYNNQIRYNDISANGTNGHGMYLGDSANTTLRDNHIASLVGKGIITVTSNNFMIMNNTIITFGISGYGLELGQLGLGGVNDSNVTNNNITTHGNYGYGMRLYLSNNNLLNNDHIQTKGYYGLGLLVDNSTNNTIQDETITTQGVDASGVYLYLDYTKNRFSNLVIQTNNISANAMHFDNNDISDSTITITDSILNSSYPLVKEVNITGLVNRITINFTNVTRSDNSEINISFSSGANATVNMFWYLYINVTNMTNQYVVGANVTLWDVNRIFLFSDYTPGNISRKIVKAYSQNQSGRFNTTPLNMTVNATGQGYVFYKNESILLNNNLLINVKLQEASGTTQISSCGVPLNAPNTYYNLTNSVNSTGTCFEITGHNITLNCNYHRINFSTITNSLDNGIRINNALNINVINCNISQIVSGGNNWYKSGIYLLNTSNSTIENTSMQTLGIDDRSLRIYSSQNNNFKNVIINTSSSGTAIYLEGSGPIPNNNRFTNVSIISNPTYGIDLETMTISGTYLIDTSLSNYNMLNNQIIFLKETDYGEIRFTNTLGTSTGSHLFDDNESSIISISNNSIKIRPIAAFDRSANLTFYGFNSLNLVNPAIYKNGLKCLDCSFIGNTSNDYFFNITGFGNYSLGENYDLPAVDHGVSPVNGSFYSEGAVYNFSITVNNTNGTVILVFNNTNYSSINVSDVFNVSIGNLSAGTYEYYWFLQGVVAPSYDEYGRTNFTILPATPSIGFNSSIIWSINYSMQANVSGDCPSQLVCLLYRNDTPNSISSPDISILAAGTYNYTYNTSGNENYTYNSISGVLTVNKADGRVNLTLNNDASNITVEVGSVVNFSVSTDYYQIMRAYDNDAQPNNFSYTNSSSFNFSKQYNNTGSYLIIVNASGNENYTESTRSYTLFVNDTTPPSVQNINVTVTNDSATINWTTNELADSNILTTNPGPTNNVSESIPVMNHSLRFDNLYNNTDYYFNITSCDQNNNCNTTPIFNFTTLNNTVFAIGAIAPIINITNLTATPSNIDGSITLSWDADNNPDVYAYKIYRSNETITDIVNSTNVVNVYNTTSLIWQDTYVNVSQNYYYALTAVDFLGNENQSAFSENTNATSLVCAEVWSVCTGFGTCTSGVQTGSRTRTCYNGGAQTQSCTQTCIVAAVGGGGGGVSPSIPPVIETPTEVITPPTVTDPLTADVINDITPPQVTIEENPLPQTLTESRVLQIESLISDDSEKRYVASKTYDKSAFGRLLSGIEVIRTQKEDNGSTIIMYNIKNNAIIDYTKIALIIDIPKDIANTTAELNGVFITLKEDPQIAFYLGNITRKTEKAINFSIKRNLTKKDADTINHTLRFEVSESELLALQAKANQTTQAIGITKKALVFENKTDITVTLDPKNEMDNLTVYLEIPKCLAETIKEIEFELEDFEVIQDDPLVSFSFTSINEVTNIEFHVLKPVSADCWEKVKTLPIADRIGDRIIVKDKKKTYLSFGIFAFVIIFALILNYIQKKSEHIEKKTFMQKLEFGAIESMLILIIAFNLFEFFNLLSPDFEFVAKLLSVTVLTLLLYEINLEEIFYGKKSRFEMISLLLANFLIMIRMFVDWIFISYNKIVETRSDAYIKYLYQTVIDFEMNHPGLIVEVSMIAGFAILIIISFFDIFKDIEAPSLFEALHMKGKAPGFTKKIERFFVALIIYLAFYIIFFNFFIEWLAIGIDSTITLFAIIVYGIRFIIKHKHHYDEEHVINKIGDAGEMFYSQFINLFKYRYTILFGLSGILILHLIVDLGNYIIPFILNMNNELYFSQINTSHLTLYAILSNIFTSDIINNVAVLLNYGLNILFIIICMVFPIYVWYDIYRNHAINLPRILVALLFTAVINYVLQPLIKIGSINTGSILGVDIVFRSGTGNNNLEILIASVFVGVFAFIIAENHLSRIILKMLGVFVIFGFFFIYIFFYVKSWIYSLLPHIISLLQDLTVTNVMIMIMLTLFLAIVVLFYIFSFIYFVKLVYEEWIVKKYVAAHLMQKYSEALKNCKTPKEKKDMLTLIKEVEKMRKELIPDLEIEEKLYEQGVSEKTIKEVIYL